MFESGEAEFIVMWLVEQCVFLRKEKPFEKNFETAFMSFVSGC